MNEIMHAMPGRKTLKHQLRAKLRTAITSRKRCGEYEQQCDQVETAAAAAAAADTVTTKEETGIIHPPARPESPLLASSSLNCTLDKTSGEEGSTVDSTAQASSSSSSSPRRKDKTQSVNTSSGISNKHLQPTTYLANLQEQPSSLLDFQSAARNDKHIEDRLEQPFAFNSSLRVASCTLDGTEHEHEQDDDDEEEESTRRSTPHRSPKSPQFSPELDESILSIQHKRQASVLRSTQRSVSDHSLRRASTRYRQSSVKIRLFSDLSRKTMPEETPQSRSEAAATAAAVNNERAGGSSSSASSLDMAAASNNDNNTSSQPIQIDSSIRDRTPEGSGSPVDPASPSTPQSHVGEVDETMYGHINQQNGLQTHAYATLVNNPNGAQRANHNDVLAPIVAMPASDTHEHHHHSDFEYSIRLTPFVDHSSNTPALYIGPVEREMNASDTVRIGRFADRQKGPGPESVVFKSKVVSRTHAEFFVKEGQWYVRDLKSSSGTFLNHVRLSHACELSEPHLLSDGDLLQLGMDFRGGSEEVYKCIKARVELNWSWKRKANNFNVNALKNLRGLFKSQQGGGGDHQDMQECAICLLPVSPLQALFIAPCSHAWHYKCIRPIVVKAYPHFVCPNCRTLCDLEADVEVPDLSHLEEQLQGLATG